MIITITNRKGGVGKTTFAHHIAAGIAQHGFNVGLVDTDPQGGCAESLGLPPANSLYQVMVEHEPLQKHLVHVDPRKFTPPDVGSTGKLWLLRGDFKTHKISAHLEAHDILTFDRLVQDMKRLAELDVIIVDSQPSVSSLDGIIYLATDAFVYVTECEAKSIKALLRSMKEIEAFNADRERVMGRKTRILAIIPNKYRTSTNVHQDNINALGRRFGSFDDGGLVMPPVRQLTVWPEASQNQTPVFLHEPTGEAAGDVWKIIDRMARRLGEWNSVEAEQ